MSDEVKKILDHVRFAAANEARSRAQWSAAPSVPEQVAFRSGCEATAEEIADYIERFFQ